MLSLSLFSLLVSPLPAISAESDPAGLIASLNSKTAKNKYESTTEGNKNGMTTKVEEVYTYVFALDRKEKLEIRFNEVIQTFKNGRHIDENLYAGKISFNPADIDPQRIQSANNQVIITCLDLKKCMDGDFQTRVTNTKGETTFKSTDNIAANSFTLRGFYNNQPLVEQIKKDLQALFTLLALPNPAPKPEQEIPPGATPDHQAPPI